MASHKIMTNIERNVFITHFSTVVWQPPSQPLALRHWYSYTPTRMHKSHRQVLWAAHLLPSAYHPSSHPHPQHPPHPHWPRPTTFAQTLISGSRPTPS